MCPCLKDEGALVRAARNLGFVFSGRTPDSVIVETVSNSQEVRGIDANNVSFGWSSVTSSKHIYYDLSIQQLQETDTNRYCDWWRKHKKNQFFSHLIMIKVHLVDSAQSDWSTFAIISPICPTTDHKRLQGCTTRIEPFLPSLISIKSCRTSC